jgi:hypothetical protein
MGVWLCRRARSCLFGAGTPMTSATIMRMDLGFIFRSERDRGVVRRRVYDGLTGQVHVNLGSDQFGCTIAMGEINTLRGAGDSPVSTTR